MASHPIAALPPAGAPAEEAPASPTAHWGSVHLLAVIVFVAACWAGRELLVPIMVGLFLSLVANPLVARLCRWHVPRWIAAFFVVFGGFALAVTLASQLVAPTTQWIQKAPQELRQVAPKLKSLVRKVDDANKAAPARAARRLPPWRRRTRPSRRACGRRSAPRPGCWR
jgi:predicted PurR-regulated permease PerM